MQLWDSEGSSISFTQLGFHHRGSTTMHPQPGKATAGCWGIHRHRHWWKDISFRWWWQCCTVVTGVAMAWAVLLVSVFPQYFKGVQCHQLAIKWIIGLFDWLVGIRSCAFPILLVSRKKNQKVKILQKYKLKLKGSHYS